MSWREVGICRKCGHKEMIDSVTELCIICEDEIENILLNALDEAEFIERIKNKRESR